jgi:hypothetical protein
MTAMTDGCGPSRKSDSIRRANPLAGSSASTLAETSLGGLGATRTSTKTSSSSGV